MNLTTEKNYISSLKKFNENKDNYLLYFNNLSYASQKMLIASLTHFSKYETKLANYLNDLKPKLKKEVFNKTRPSLSFSDLKKVKDYCETLELHKKAIILTMTETGCRKFEINQIWNKYDGTSTCFIISKAGKVAKIYINSKLRKVLNDWKASTNFKLYSLKFIENLTKKVLNECGLSGTPHDLRRAFATNLRKNCVNLEQIQIYLRHNDINTTLKYIKYTDEEMLEVLDRMNEDVSNEWINDNNYKDKIIDLITKNNNLIKENKELKERIKELEHETSNRSN